VVFDVGPVMGFAAAHRPPHPARAGTQGVGVALDAAERCPSHAFKDRGAYQ
jgi:hypothetical protein